MGINKIDVKQLVDDQVYAVILIKEPDGQITFDLIKSELIVDAIDRLIDQKPNCEVRLFMRELHPKYFAHPSITKIY